MRGWIRITLLVAALFGAVVPSASSSESYAPSSLAESARPYVPVAVPTTALAPAPVVPAPVAPAPPPAPARTRPVMFIGDSMAYTAAEGLAPLASGFGFNIINEGIFGCGVVRGGPYRYVGATHAPDARCEQWPELWSAALERNHPEVVAVLIGRWELMDRVHDDRWTNVLDPTFAAYVESEIDRAVELASSSGSRVVLLTTPHYRRAHPAGGLWAEDDPARVDAVNGILRRVAEHRGAPWIDAGGWLSPGGLYTPLINGTRVRSDGVHLTRETGALLAPWFFPLLSAATS